MGHKIFISYKYKDDNVCQTIENHLTEQKKGSRLTARDYVDVLEKYIEEKSSHEYKGEEDDEPLNDKSEEWIWEKLKDDMFDSTLTIVLISPNMDNGSSEREQWIPWEIQYSLSNKTRTNNAGNQVRSHTNAMLAIVLPDRNNSYTYYFEHKTCCPSGCRLNKTDRLFPILRKNTFNQTKDENVRICLMNDKIYSGGMHSYIPFYKWKDVNNKESLESAIQHAYDIQSQEEKYDICRELDK